MNCSACGTAMLPLFTGEFCPNDCDRIPDKMIDNDSTPKWFDLGDLDSIVCVKSQMCPRCGSMNSEPFPLLGDPNALHCLPCGHVW